MSDCARHKKDVAGISDMEELAKQIGDLHYESLTELMAHLAFKLNSDSVKDTNAGRVKLGKALMSAAYKIEDVMSYINMAWNISKPFMVKKYKMKTLVIHPKDTSTDFLSEIYSGTDWTLIDSNVSNSSLKNAIIEHDRVIMLGHGDDYGLYGHGCYMIDSDLVYLLREKECVAIWCNADVFFKKYGLKGIYSGMIISEYDEAILMCIYAFTTQDIETSNQLFSTAIKHSITGGDAIQKFNDLYKDDSNKIIAYNRIRLYITSDSAFL